MPRDRLLRGIGAALLVILLYLPCLSMMVQRAGDWGTGWLSWSPSMLFQLVGLYAVPVEVLTIGSAVAALVMVVLAKRAIQHGLETPGWNEDRALLLLWWGPPIMAAIISQIAIPVFLPRTLAATIAAREAGFTHIVLALSAPYPEGIARTIRDEVIVPAVTAGPTA